MDSHDYLPGIALGFSPKARIFGENNKCKFILSLCNHTLTLIQQIASGLEIEGVSSRNSNLLPAVLVKVRRSEASKPWSQKDSKNLTFEPYPYRPLHYSTREIRLLVLEPGKGQTAIRCRLIHANLDTSPTYTALSYTWADWIIPQAQRKQNIK